MRLSDLLGSQVIGEDGKGIGRVHEVRTIQDGPLQDAFGAALRIEGLVVGRGSIGTRLGLDRPDARSPAAVRIIFEGVKGARLFVPWDRVVTIQEKRIDVSGTRKAFDAPAPLPASEQVDKPSG